MLHLPWVGGGLLVVRMLQPSVKKLICWCLADACTRMLGRACEATEIWSGLAWPQKGVRPFRAWQGSGYYTTPLHHALPISVGREGGLVG